MKICYGELERVVKAVEHAALEASKGLTRDRAGNPNDPAKLLNTAVLILRSMPLEIENVSNLRP